MRPLTVITGIVLGSSAAIAISLAAVLLIFLLLDGQYPRLQHELRPLAVSLAIFVGMTMISGLSFYTLLMRHQARFWLQLLLWAGVAATAWYYWP